MTSTGFSRSSSLFGEEITGFHIALTPIFTGHKFSTGTRGSTWLWSRANLRMLEGEKGCWKGCENEIRLWATANLWNEDQRCCSVLTLLRTVPSHFFSQAWTMDMNNLFFLVTNPISNFCFQLCSSLSHGVKSMKIAMLYSDTYFKPSVCFAMWNRYLKPFYSQLKLG